MLLTVIGFKPDPIEETGNSFFLLIGMIDDKKNIERRIRMIKMTNFFKTKGTFVLVIGLISVVLLSGMLLISGLTKSKSAQNKSTYQNQTTYSARVLFQYKQSYIGDNSNVVNLIDNLPYANLRKEVSLQTQNTPYGITINFDFSTVDIDIRQLETIFRNNAII
jgi:Domain of unknown function (DUF4825)